MKKALLLFVLSLIVLLHINAQQLCVNYKTEIVNNKAQLSVYIQSDTTLPAALASYSMLLFFNQDKAHFERIDYNPGLWEQTFAAPNPLIQRAKGKLNASMQIAAVDMKPSSETKILQPTLLYSIQFKGGKGKLKKGDFSLLLLDQSLPEINYADYQGTSFAMSLCDFPDRKKTKETNNVPFTLAPNPTCGSVQITLEQLPQRVAFCIVYDLQGKLIQQRALAIEDHDFRLDVSALKTGVYFLTLQVDGSIWTDKLLIQDCANDEKPAETNYSNNTQN